MRLCMWTCVLVAVPSSIWEFVKGVGLLQWHNVADCLPVQFTCICTCISDSHSICFNYEIILFHNILFESIPRMLNKMHKSYWSYYLKSWGTSATSRCVTWLTRGVLSSCSAAQRPSLEQREEPLVGAELKVETWSQTLWLHLHCRSWWPIPMLWLYPIYVTKTRPLHASLERHHFTIRKLIRYCESLELVITKRTW